MIQVYNLHFTRWRQFTNYFRITTAYSVERQHYKADLLAQELLLQQIMQNTRAIWEIRSDIFGHDYSYYKSEHSCQVL